MHGLPNLIEECRAALRRPDAAQRVQRVVSRIVRSPAELEATLGAVDPVDPPTAEYTFLHQSPELTVMKVLMPGFLEGPPHNHLVWAVIGVYAGREANVFYRRDGANLAEAGRRELIAPDVLVLAADAIHSISNPLRECSHALHVYGGSLANPARSLWNPFTFEEEPFQLSAMSHYEDQLMPQSKRGAR